MLVLTKSNLGMRRNWNRVWDIILEHEMKDLVRRVDVLL